MKSTPIVYLMLLNWLESWSELQLVVGVATKEVSGRRQRRKTRSLLTLKRENAGAVVIEDEDAKGDWHARGWVCENENASIRDFEELSTSKREDAGAVTVENEDAGWSTSKTEDHWLTEDEGYRGEGDQRARGSFPIYAGAHDSENNSSIFLGQTALTDLEISTISQPATARWPFFIFLAGSMFCLLSSSLCHLLGCQSHRCNLLLVRIDYVGIAVMIVASFFPPIYYIFQCDPHWQFVYLAGITTMGVATTITLLSPLHSSTAAFRAFRAGIFASMGLSGIIPAVHATIANWNEPMRNVTLAYEASMAVAYLVGAVFYVSRIPEKWKPGRFDLAGQSHQIFHVLVVLGALAHYGAVIVFLDWRDRVACDRLG
ncbi:hypothetical protein ACLOJK_027686 [Asimina triloba]